jgi:signal transduction histidine kinase
MAPGRLGRILIPVAAVAVGLLSLAAARRDPVNSFAGTSALRAIAELAAGWSLVAAGLLFWMRHVASRVGPLLTATGLAWFVQEWASSGVGSSLAFTAGLVGFVACVPLLAHGALAYPTGRLRSGADVAVVLTSYVGAIVLLGLLPASVFDPRATGCFECPQNLVLVRGDADAFDTLNRWGLWIGLGWVAALVALLVWRLAHSSRAVAAVVVPALVPAIAYLGLVAWEFHHSLARGFLSNDRTVWSLEAGVLTALAGSVGWGLLRERQARISIARLVVELGRLPRPGAVREALAETLGDPTLELVYRQSATGGYVDALGRPVELEPGIGRAVTPLLRGDVPVAALVHDERLLDRPGLLQEVLAGARIAVENEQLQAEVRAQVEELRASRARIVEAADTERQRLERDLHDGAQQSLLAVSYDLRRARTAADDADDSSIVQLLATAGAEAQTALGELRDLAHGIYPAILAEAGLAAAFGALADEAPLPLELGELPDGRYSTPVETAVYLAVAEAVRDAFERRATFVAADVVRDGERLVLGVRDDGAARTSALVHLLDRIGALGGSVEVGPTTLRAAVPCA